jgi:6-phosphogluconate dehydrogenase
MKIGYIGLGKMGFGQVALLLEKGHEVVVWNRSKDPVKEAVALGATEAVSYADFKILLHAPRVIWLMLPHAVVDTVLAELIPHLEKGDIIIDGGNSLYIDSMRRGEELSSAGLHFMDIGTSGGPAGARNGACLMIGGEKDVYQKLEPLFKDLAAPDSYLYAGTHGAGHFVKMVHNGIEYGMMQAIGEGFEVLKKSEFNLDLEKVAKLYNNKSVIESRLVGWLDTAYREHGLELAGISGEVSHSGEGLWTVEAAKRMGIEVPIIEKSLQFRIDSKGNPSYTGQVVSALRNQFGGHDVAGK